MSPHPDWEPTEDWPQEVPVVRYETEGGVALIAPVLPSLEELADLPIERVIIPHGDLILSDGAARIREAVEDARG